MQCKKCGMYKMSENQKCACTAKKFNEEKLSKKANPQPIKQVSEKKKAEIKDRGSLIDFYSKISKGYFNEYGEGACEYCGKQFNIKYDLIDNRVAFAHILAKGDPLFKHLSTFKNNIAIVCSEKCHKGMDAEICRLGIKNDLKIKIESGEKIDVSNLEKYSN